MVMLLLMMIRFKDSDTLSHHGGRRFVVILAIVQTQIGGILVDHLVLRLVVILVLNVVLVLGLVLLIVAID